MELIMSKESKSVHNLKKGGVDKNKNVNVRTLLNEACIVAGNIISILGDKTKQLELLNQNELANYKTAVEVLKASRELTLKTNALNAAKATVHSVQNPMAEIDTQTLLKLTKGAKDE